MGTATMIITIVTIITGTMMGTITTMDTIIIKINTIMITINTITRNRCPTRAREEKEEEKRRAERIQSSARNSSGSRWKEKYSTNVANDTKSDARVLFVREGFVDTFFL